MANNVSIETLMQEIEQILEDSGTFPLSGGKVLVDPATICEIIEEIRGIYPKEIMEAQKIVKERGIILRDAQEEAEKMVTAAEKRRKSMISEHEIVKRARIEAEEIISQASMKSQEIRRAANDYIEEQLERVEKYLSANLSTFKEARKNVKLSQRASHEG